MLQTHSEEIAASLSAAADRLAEARDTASFVAAMKDHRRVWRGMRQAEPTLGYKIPDRVMRYSMSIIGKPDGEWNDQEIEALITIDRNLFQAFQPPAE
jgi:hypothetical protein